MTDRAASYIRTFWPLLLGHLAAVLGAFVAHRFGVVIDGTLALMTVGLVATAIVYWTGRRLEHANDEVLQKIGRWIMSANWDIGPPVYPEKPKETNTSAPPGR